MAGDIIVWLRAGTYAQAETLTFGPEDSGTNGHDVVYRAHPGERVVVSGGRELAGWTAVPGAGFWAAPFGAGPGSRQLCVDGVRADRAAASVALLGAMIGQPGGYVVTNTAIQTWRNPAALEFVYTGGGGVPGAPSTESRCGIASLVPAGSGRTRIVMDQPCFDSGQAKSPGPLANPTAIENAYELLARAGQWYLDLAAGKVYYWPRAGQDMTSAHAVVPVLERLALAAGTAERLIEHVAFEGLEFAHATWQRPSSGDGFIELQANTFIVGPDLLNMPGNVEVHHARQLRFERCIFRHLGAEGLVFGPGSAGNVVRGCVFTDTSGVPLRIGDVNAPLAAPVEQVRDNRVENNLIHGAPVEYHGGPAIVVGYAAGTEIAHNEIANVPYSGISAGWGWGEVSYADGQRVHHNRVHDVMGRLRDGGNVYVLGPQPDSATPRSSIDNNWLCLDIQPFGTIYLDQGSRGWHVHDNLVTQTATNWIYLQHLAPPAIDNLVERNLHDTAAAVIGDPSNTLTDNHLIGSESGAWPERAWTIANGSGLEPAFLDLAGDGVPRNVARGRAAIASSYDDPSRAPSAAVDGDGRTCWSSAAGDTAPWIRIDLGAAYRLCEIQLATRQDANRADARHDFEIRASNDPDQVPGEILLGGQGEQVLPWWDVFRLVVTDSTPYRYVFAVKTDGLPFSVGEFRALGGGAPPAGPPAGPKEPQPRPRVHDGFPGGRRTRRRSGRRS